MLEFTIKYKGGPGSGHHGHAGRPGDVGGSTPGAGVKAGDSVAFVYYQGGKPATGNVVSVTGGMAHVTVAGGSKTPFSVDLANIVSVDVKKKPLVSVDDESGTISPKRYGDFEVYTVGYGDKLPNKVFGSSAIIAYSQTAKKVYISSESSGEKRVPIFHGVLASVVGEHEDQDRWVRANYLVKPGKQPIFSISTDFAGIGDLQYSGRDPKRADAVAYRNMVSLFTILRRAGFSDAPVEWRATSSTVTLPIEEVKSLRGASMIFVMRLGVC